MKLHEEFKEYETMWEDYKQRKGYRGKFYFVDVTDADFELATDKAVETFLGALPAETRDYLKARFSSSLKWNMHNFTKKIKELLEAPSDYEGSAM